MSRARSLSLVLVAAIVLAAGARIPAADKQEFSSRWRDRDVRIDGIDEEWRDLLQPVKGEHFSVAFQNDGDALYFCLVTTNSVAIKQIARMGLTVWLDPAGGKKKTFGARFPAHGSPRPQPGRPPGAQPPGDAASGSQPVGVRPPDIDVLGPGSKDVRQVENGNSGIIARMGGNPNLLVYEIKIPLRRTDAVVFAPDVDAGAALRVELETSEWRGPVPVSRGGWPVSVGIGGPNGGVFYPGPDTALLKPLDVSGTLRLASAPR